MAERPSNIESDLTALADGSLEPERRESIEAQLHRSSDMAATLLEQQRAVALIRSVDVQAPDSLHHQVQSLIAPGRRSVRVRLGTLGLAATAVVAAIVFALTSSGPSAPSLRQASALTLRPATLPAPMTDPAHHTQLVDSVDGVPFPYWEERFGWNSAGARTDRIGDRLIRTVFYTNTHGQRIGYSIVSGPAPAVHGGSVTWRGGVSYRLLAENGVPVVTWLRSGHLCVVSGREVNSAVLLALASWSNHKAIAS